MPVPLRLSYDLRTSRPHRPRVLPPFGSAAVALQVAPQTRRCVPARRVVKALSLGGMRRE